MTLHPSKMSIKATAAILVLAVFFLSFSGAHAAGGIFGHFVQPAVTFIQILFESEDAYYDTYVSTIYAFHFAGAHENHVLAPAHIFFHRLYEGGSIYMKSSKRPTLYTGKRFLVREFRNSNAETLVDQPINENGTIEGPYQFNIAHEFNRLSFANDIGWIDLSPLVAQGKKDIIKTVEVFQGKVKPGDYVPIITALQATADLKYVNRFTVVQVVELSKCSIVVDIDPARHRFDENHQFCTEAVEDTYLESTSIATISRKIIGYESRSVGKYSLFNYAHHLCSEILPGCKGELHGVTKVFEKSAIVVETQYLNPDSQGRVIFEDVKPRVIGLPVRGADNALNIIVPAHLVLHRCYKDFSPIKPSPSGTELVTFVMATGMRVRAFGKSYNYASPFGPLRTPDFSYTAHPEFGIMTFAYDGAYITVASTVDIRTPDLKYSNHQLYPGEKVTIVNLKEETDSFVTLEVQVVSLFECKEVMEIPDTIYLRMDEQFCTKRSEHSNGESTGIVFLDDNIIGFESRSVGYYALHTYFSFICSELESECNVQY